MTQKHRHTRLYRKCVSRPLPGSEELIVVVSVIIVSQKLEVTAVFNAACIVFAITFWLASVTCAVMHAKPTLVRVTEPAVMLIFAECGR